jgi:hypothetical protein
MGAPAHRDTEFSERLFLHVPRTPPPRGEGYPAAAS